MAAFDLAAGAGPSIEMHPAQAPLHIPAGNVGPLIRSIAARHRVRYVETAGDRTAAHYAGLSDSAVRLDENERLITALYRAGVLSRSEHDDLHDAYIRNDLGLD